MTVSSSCPPGVKPSSEMDMTDGCGLINLQALHSLHEQLGLWADVPTAIQCRIAGAKVLPNEVRCLWYPKSPLFRVCYFNTLERRRVAGRTPVSG
jgi:hypothetical protein